MQAEKNPESKDKINAEAQSQAFTCQVDIARNLLDLPVTGFFVVVSNLSIGVHWILEIWNFE